METRPCDLCGTPYKPRHAEERFCCKGCAFVYDLVGDKATRPAHAIHLGRLWSRVLGAGLLFLLASLNLLLAQTVTFSEPGINNLLRLVAVLFALMGISVLCLSGRGTRTPR